MPPVRVLIIDDSEDDREAFRRMLTRAPATGFDVIEAATGEDGVRLFRESSPHCILLDYSLPGRNGVAVLEDIRKTHPFAAAVMLTGQGSEAVAVDVMKAGAQDYLTKDTISRDALERAISHAVARQQLAAKLEQQRQSLEIFSRAMAHDLKEPLRTIRSFGGLVRKSEALTEEDGRLMDHVLRAADNMEELIAAITRYTRVEAQGRIRFEPVSMSGVVAQVRASLMSQIDAGRATIEERDLSTINGDGSLLVQLVQNLVSNAIRYCTDAPPLIAVSMVRGGDATELRIADNGPGVPEEFREEIFKPFKRLVGREIAGSGLGLAICRRIAELHGASIRCDRGPGGGAVFVLSFAAEDSPGR